MAEPHVSNAKHLLACSHCIGSNCTEFDMKAEVLKDMGDGRLKVRVFGDLHWKNTEHKHRIRYVEAWRVRRNPNMKEFQDES